MKEAEIEQTRNLEDKTMPLCYPKITKSRPYLVPTFQEKYDYFLSHFGGILVKKGAWSHFKGSESKSHLAYTGTTIPGIQNMQRVWSQHMPVLSLSVTKVVFFLIFNHFFKFRCFFRYHAPTIEKNEVDFLVQNLILSRMAPVWNFKTLKQKSSCGIFFMPRFHFWQF